MLEFYGKVKADIGSRDYLGKVKADMDTRDFSRNMGTIVLWESKDRHKCQILRESKGRHGYPRFLGEK